MKLYSQAISRTVLLAVIIPLLIISLFYVLMTYQSQRHQASQAIKVNASAVSVELQRRLFLHMQRARSTSRMFPIYSAVRDPEQYQAANIILEKMMANFTTVAGIAVLDKQGQLVTDISDVVNTTVVDRVNDWLADSLSTNSLFRAAVITIPAIDGTQAVRSYFVSAVALSDNRAKSKNVNKRVGTLLIFHDLARQLAVVEGALNVASDYDLQYQLWFKQQLLIGRTNNKTRIVLDKPRLIRRNVYDSQGAQAPLLLKASASNEMVLKSVLHNMLLVITFIVITLVVTWVLIQRLTVRLKQPVTQIIEMSQQFTRGDYAQKINKFSHHEFQDIANALNRMAETINSQLLSLNQETQKAQASEKLKGQFLANMSHEIRTPMNAIMGFVQLMKTSTLTEKQRFQLDKIDSSCTLLLALINDILDLSKIEANGLKLIPEPIDINELLQDSVDLFQPSADNKFIALAYVSNIISPYQLICDPIRLRQVINNLLSNAIKFTQTGRVEISLKEQMADDEGVDLVIQVKDTGIGIDEQSLTLLFEPFVQVEGQSTRRYSGTGLGLSICKQLVTLMKGRIDVSSELGIGTVFAIHLRLLKVSQFTPTLKPNHIASSPLEQRGENTRILVVEDNEINQLVLCHMIEALNIQYDIAVNGQQACELAAECQYDLILMDLQMPVMDGLTASRVLTSQPQFTTPIVAVTANVMPVDIKSAKEAGMSDYLAKPIEMKALQEVINKWLCITPLAHAE